MLNANRIQAAGARYRPDIDGLRAVAVVPVVLYHFHVPGFSGGFVGVDVFFVISGYLITALIHAEMLEGRFTIASFYERRIRRIFPALFFMLAGVTLLSLPILFPQDFARFSRSLLATTAFSSNILFWQEAGYFDVAASVKPLLHTWSLAVEEQFYLIYPAILFLLRKSSRTILLTTVIVLLLASFGASVAGVALVPGAAFYLLPTRMWELMIGAILALGALPAPRSKLLREALGAAGLALIAIAVVFFSAQTPFPGAAALLPCVGAALVILAGTGGRSLISNALSASLPVFIGLISYSLYLWHWPLFVLGGYYAINGLGTAETVGLIGLSVLLAWISYRFVEQPFRGKAGILSRRGIFTTAGLAMTCASAAAVVIGVNHGMPQRFDQKVLALVGRPERRTWREGCFGLPIARVASGTLCRIGDAHAPVTFVLWGDSHANALVPGLDRAAARKGVAGLVVGRPACAPLLGVDRIDSRQRSCRAFNDAVVELLRNRHDIREVVLMARWSRAALGTSYAATESDSKIVWLVDDRSTSQSMEENKVVFARGLERTLSVLSRLNKKVVVVGAVPEVSWTVPETMAKLNRLHRNYDIRPSVNEYLERQGFVLHVMDTLRGEYPVMLVSPAAVLCGQGRCDIERDGRPLYVDAHHLSAYGAQQLTPLLETVFHEG